MSIVEATIPAKVSDPDHDGQAITPVTFTYAQTNPYAVMMAIPTVGHTVLWCYTRDMLATGLKTATGIGDVSIHPGNPHFDDDIGIVLTRDTQALIEVPRTKIKRFLRRTYALVPPGEEHLHVENFDDALAKLLGSQT